MTLSALVLVCVAAVLPASPRAAANAEAPRRDATRGVIVVRVGSGSASAVAGLLPGDILLSWQRRAVDGCVEATGAFRSPFDAERLDLEQIPSGPVDLEVLRDGEERTLVHPADNWDVDTRPAMTPPELESYLRGLAARDRGDADGLVDICRIFPSRRGATARSFLA